MAVVKLRKKAKLDKLIAKLTLRLGKKITQQDVMDACIDLSFQYIDKLEDRFNEKNRLSKDLVKEIIEMAEEFDYETKGSIDEDLYEY